jgi:hypothetical protein
MLTYALVLVPAAWLAWAAWSGRQGGAPLPKNLAKR